MDTTKYIVDTIEKLVNIPSPSGFAMKAIDYVKKEAESMSYKTELNNKGGLIITVEGKTDEVLALSAHVDTLGAMVRSITASGTLKFAAVGGYTMNSIEGEYVKIHTRDGKEYEGTVLCTSPSVHVQDDARTAAREIKNMEIRLDKVVKSKEDVEELGIATGDYISFEPRFRYVEGFVKSRHLDDKASVAVLLALLQYMHEEKLVPKQTLKLIITNYEEVGFGASSIPSEITEFISVDMGCVGDDLNGSEYKVSICAKDSAGPYDYDMTTRLVNIAKERELDYCIDFFPHYGSDASAAISAGNDIRIALIGQGIHASHGMERTHITSLENTLELIKGYLEV